VKNQQISNGKLSIVTPQFMGPFTFPYWSEELGPAF
jgi:hypothetical protein